MCNLYYTGNNASAIIFSFDCCSYFAALMFIYFCLWKVVLHCFCQKQLFNNSSFDDVYLQSFYLLFKTSLCSDFFCCSTSLYVEIFYMTLSQSVHDTVTVFNVWNELTKLNNIYIFHSSSKHFVETINDKTFNFFYAFQ